MEVDETFISRIKGAPKKPTFYHKMTAMALIDRGSRKARAPVVSDVTARTPMPIVRANVAKEATIVTDKHNEYFRVADQFVGHGTTTPLYSASRAA